MKSDWTSKPVGQVCTFHNGLWTGKKPPYAAAGVFRNTDFGRDGELKDGKVVVLQVEAKQLAKRLLQYGDIILEKSGGGPKQAVGRVAFYDKLEGVHSFSNFTSVIRVINADELLPQYLLKFLFWTYLSGVTERMQSHSTGIRNLNGDAYKAIDVPLPPLDEQRRIVAVLDKAFEGIATATANAQKNVAKARSLFESYLNRELAQSSKSAKRAKLVDLCFKGRIITYGVIKLGDETPDGVPCLRTSNVRWLYIDQTGMKRIEPALSEQYRRTILEGGEVLVNVRGTLGGVAVASDEMVGWNVSREVAVVPVGAESFLPEYIAYWIGRKDSQDWLTGVQKGAAYSGINIADLRELSVDVPSVSEQQRIVDRLSSTQEKCNDLARVAKAKLAALSELKQSLLQKAFAGELT